MSEFVKYGDSWFRKDDKGQLMAVTDPDTAKALKSGQLSYKAVPNTRGLTFANPEGAKYDVNTGRPLNMGTSLKSEQDASPAPQDDIASMIKQKLVSALSSYQGATNTAELEQKRQALLRQQLLASPYSEEGEKELTGAQKLGLLRQRGSEFEPEIKSLEEQILKAKQGDEASINNLTKLASIANTMGLFDSAGGYESGIGKEYSDYVRDEQARGNTNIMTLNEYADMDANRKRSITNVGGSGLDASTMAKVTTIAQQHDTNQIVKDYNTVQNKAGSMQKILESGVGGPGDLALVYEFMKALDPNSVVRETEYATAAKSGNIFAGVFARFNGYLKEQGGFLPSQVQNAFVSIMKTKLDVITEQYDNYHSEQARKINKITGQVDGEDYLTNYGNVNFEEPQAPKSQFDDLKQYITIQGKYAYIPRSVWSTLGARMDALLKEARDDGYTLLVK